jgi:hypothetical protein
MFTRSLPFYLLKQTRLASTNVSLGENLRGNLFVKATDTDNVDLRARLLEELKISLKVCSRVHSHHSLQWRPARLKILSPLQQSVYVHRLDPCLSYN